MELRAVTLAALALCTACSDDDSAPGAVQPTAPPRGEVRQVLEAAGSFDGEDFEVDIGGPHVSVHVGLGSDDDAVASALAACTALLVRFPDAERFSILGDVNLVLAEGPAPARDGDGWQTFVAP